MCEGLVVLNKGFALVTSQGMLDATHAAIDDLDNAIASAVGSRPEFILVDTRNALAGHDVCASDRWVNQVNGNPLDADHESLHPNTAGYQAIAKVLAKRLDAGYFADGTVDQSIVNGYNTYRGPDAFGYAANNGGGTYVHYWSGGAEANVQDFTGGNSARRSSCKARAPVSTSKADSATPTSAADGRGPATLRSPTSTPAVAAPGRTS